jgi:alkylation response protein AidB-like acyl-CoA dehydrogenase
VPIAITEEQLALQASIREWAKRAGPLALVRRLEPDPLEPDPTAKPADKPADEPDPKLTQQCLSDLADLGIFSIAIPEEHGGAGGTVADLAAAIEQLTSVLAPGPITPTLLAGQLLTAHKNAAHKNAAHKNAASALLPELAAGNAPTAVALAATMTGTQSTDGTIHVTGETGPVLGATTTSRLLLGATTDHGEKWFLLPAGHNGVTVTPRQPVDFSRPLAGIRLDDAVITPDEVLDTLSTTQVRDLAATLYAAEAAAVAAWCCDTAAAYASTRRQFGRPIGAFQAVKHLCAGLLCRAERAAVLAWDAARAADEAPDEHPLAAAAAAAVALDAAVDNAKDCIQVLGGIGFTWEHDAHLYLRRALALRQLLGGSATWRARTGELALAGQRRHVVSATPNRPAPAPPRQDQVIGGWAVPAITAHGTDAQRDRFAGPTTRGEITWCQLFSEPEAGSDLASLRTRAERTVKGDSEGGMGRRAGGGGWLLTGQKVWTSLAREADWAICLARTDPEVPKHRGITFFLVDMKSPGIDIRPLREITGRAVFNEVFLDDVFVPDDCVVGAPGEGWRITRTTLATERVAMGSGSALDEAVEGLITTVRSGKSAQDPRVQEQIGAHVAEGLAVSLLDLRDCHAAVRKLVGVAHRQSVAETALTLCGPAGAATGAAADGTDPSAEFLLTRCLSIAGGTTQILLSVAAERVLGLPREEAR